MLRLPNIAHLCKIQEWQAAKGAVAAFMLATKTSAVADFAGEQPWTRPLSNLRGGSTAHLLL